MSPPVFHYEIENKPLRAEHGRLTFTGWCVCAGESRSPAVRLVAGEQVFPLKSRRRREDVGPAHPGSPIDCGFEIEARLRPGATIVRLEASANNQEWHPLKQLTVVTTPDRLRAVIENPAQDAKVTASMRVQGWCAHADYELAEVWLHYGDQKVRCEYGLKRTDVPSLVPGAVNAPRAGFIASKNIPAGYSRLRLMGVMKTGERCIAETRTFIDVDTDEDHPDSIDLRGVRPELGAARRQLAPARPPAARAGAPLRVLFVLYGDFTSNSAIHVANLANHLANAGHTCTVAVPRNPETAASFRHARFAAIDYAEALVRSAGSPFDLVHAWTTRENVRQFCGRLKAGQPGTRLLVHLEDNEMKILELSLGRSMIELVALSAAELDELVPATLSHPRHSQDFLEQADGITVIIDTLRAQAPAGKPVHTVWPAAEASCYFPRPRPVEFRRALGWADELIVLFYHGNVHASNRTEVHELYAAVLELNRRGHPCTLIRLGRDDGDFLGKMAPQVAPHVINLGLIRNEHIPVFLSLADYFVQPGEPDPFNNLRFPSKLPEFFALGRPVILPRTNLGLLVAHGQDAYVVERADCVGIVGAILELETNPALRTRLAAGAVAFANEHFDWARSAGALEKFYQTVARPS